MYTVITKVTNLRLALYTYLELLGFKPDIWKLCLLFWK